MRNKKIAFVFLFSIFIPLNYLNLISSQLPDFQEALELRTTSGIPIYLTAFQQWTFDIISLLYDSVIVAISVGLICYFIKELKIYLALLFGFLSRYIVLLGFLLYSSQKLSTSFFSDFTKHFDLRLYILISLQLLLTLYFSYLGFNYGRRTDYFDSKDKDLYYFCGLPKKIWLLLLISFTPVAKFLSKLTIVQIYDVTDKITNINFWKDTFSFSNIFSEDSARGLTGMLGHIMAICFAWAIAITLFSLGVNAIRDKESKHRWLKISSIFILVPGTIVIIPIIRNRTWFF
jgi:hypothetical protein